MTLSKINVGYYVDTHPMIVLKKKYQSLSDMYQVSKMSAQPMESLISLQNESSVWKLPSLP